MNTFNNSAVDENATAPAAPGTEETDSFVHVMEVEEAAPTLDLSVAALHDSVGIRSPSGATQICATVTARELPDGDDDEDDSARAPVDIVVALDRSGSMHGAKLDLCVQTLELLLRELRPCDRFGLVSFSDTAVIDIPTRKLTEANRMAASAKIRSLSPGGCTNISGAIGLAAREIRAVEDPNEVRTVFLLTDGHANRGISNVGGIVDLTRGCLGGDAASSAPPVTIHTFGYGSDHDQDMLRGIAGATAGGTYYFVDSDSNVVTAFGDALGGILSVVAQNVTLTIAVPEEAAGLGVRVADVHHDHMARQADGTFTVNMGDFYAEESRDVIFEVSLAAGEGVMPYEDGPVPHASVSMSYTDTIQKKLAGSITAPTIVIARPPNSAVSPPNRHVAVQWLRVLTTVAIADAKKLSGFGDLASARARLTSHVERLRRDAAEVGAVTDPLVAQMMTELNEILAGLATRSSYADYGGQYMESRLQTHTMQRCAEPTSSTANVYRGSRKVFLQRKWAGSTK